jgi:hypothetical protein
MQAMVGDAPEQEQTMRSQPRVTVWSRSRQWLVLAVLGCVVLRPEFATAQEAPAPTLHWAYASYFGTGWYKIGEQQSAFIVNFAPLLSSGETRWFGGRDGKAVYSIRVPLTVGLTRLDFEDVPGILDPENFAMLSAGLRADVDVPVTERFSWRPSVQLSYGQVIGEGEHAWTYRGDVRARYTFGSGDLRWALIGAAGLVGYDANHGADDSFTYAALGTEFSYPLPWFASKDSRSRLYWHLLYTDFLNRMEVQGRSDQLEEITNFWQAGLAFGKEDRPIELWFLRFDRLGLAYDISPSGELRGVKFVFRSIYEP